MKKQALFALCLTAASALVVTGCATKQEAAELRAQQEATDATTTEARETASDVSAEPLPEPEIVPTVTDPQPKPAEEPAPTVRPVHPQPVPYTVTAGDSISALAVRFGVRQPDILALNPELRANPNRLRIGQKVMLPPGTDVSKKPVPRKAAAPKAATGGVVYTVQSGDVLGSIAARHGVTVKAIKEANGLKKDFIVVGQKLTIPGAKKVVAPTKKSASTAKAEPKKASAKPAEKPAKAEPTPAPAQDKAEPAADVVVPAPAPEGEQAGEEALPPPPPPVAQPQGEPAKEATPAPATRDYTVQEGEDLVSVALRWGVSLPALRAANGIDEAAGNAVAPGTTLKIPVAAE